MARVKLLAEGGPRVGMGHLARSTALAEALRLRRTEVETAGVGLTEEVTVDSTTWSPQAPGTEPDVLVVDGYGLAAGEMDGSAIVALHEAWEGGTAERDLVLEIGGEPGRGRLVELRFACLRRPFWSLTPSSVSEQVETVLVTVGGGGSIDVAGIARLVREAVPGATVQAIRGPFATEASATEGVELLDPQPHLADLFAGADLVVTAAGQTMLEAMATGTPAIGLELAPDQGPQLRAAAASGAVLAATRDELATRLADCASRDAREKLAAAARAAVDGLGAHRLATRVLGLQGAGGFPGLGGLVLEPATARDSEFLLELRNEPAVREASRNSEPVTRAEHEAWLETTLATASRALFVVRRDGAAVGQVRLDTDDAAAEISVSVIPTVRGSGVGRAAIASGTLYGLTELSYATVDAWIAADNDASRAVFKAAGFEPAGTPADGRFELFRCDARSFGW